MGKNRLYNKVRDRDMFGHHVTLNFNRKGDTYNTIIGGIASLFIKLLIFGFLAYKSYVLVSLGDNAYSSNLKQTNFEEEEAIDLASENILPFFSLNNAKNIRPIRFDLEEVSRFVDI